MMVGMRKVLVLEGAHSGAVSEAENAVIVVADKITARSLSEHLPDLVILPLFGEGFDAIDAIGQLDRLGYRGAVVVRGPILPNIRIVERELRSIAPSMTIRLTGPAG